MSSIHTIRKQLNRAYYSSRLKRELSTIDLMALIREGEEIEVIDEVGNEVTKKTLVKLALGEALCRAKDERSKWKNEFLLEVFAKYIPVDDLEEAICAGGFYEQKIRKKLLKRGMESFAKKGEGLWE